MRAPPHLSDRELVAAVDARYGVQASEFAFLPIGNDSSSFLYRVGTAEGASYVLKARKRSSFSVASLSVPHFLRRSGMSHVVAPLPTIDSRLWIEFDGFALSLYPFIDGPRGGDTPLSREQWRVLGSLTKRFHTVELPTALLDELPRERFVPSRRELVDELDEASRRMGGSDPIKRAWADAWRVRRDVIVELVQEADKLATKLAAKPLPQVLCHADLHAWNTLLDRSTHVWLMDWDEVVLAPVERDLMFIVGGIGDPQISEETASWFFEGYGTVDLDPRALRYYRFAWAVQDVAACSERIVWLHHLGEEGRHDALIAFQRMFSPGHIVDIARTSRL